MPDTLYATLGLASVECTASEVRKAYLRLARETHPDRNGQEEAFKRVQNAYSVLSDERKRREYDASLMSCRPPLKAKSGSYDRAGVSSRPTDRPRAAPRATSYSGLFAQQPARPPVHRAPHSYFPSATHARPRSGSLSSDDSTSSSDTELDSLDDVRSQRRFRRPPSDTSDDDGSGAGRFTDAEKFHLDRSSSGSSGSSSSETVESPTYSFRSARSRPSSPRSPPARWQSSPHIASSSRYQSPPPPLTRNRVLSRAPSYGEDLDWVERMERAELLEAQAERRSRSQAPTLKLSEVSSPHPHVRGPQPLYRPAHSRQSSSAFVRSAPPPPLFADQRISSSRTLSPGPSPTSSTAAPHYPTYEQAAIRVIRKRGAVPGPPLPVDTAAVRSGGASSAIRSLFSRGPPKLDPRPPPSAYGPPPPLLWGSPPSTRALRPAPDSRGPSAWASSGRGKHDLR